MATTSPDNIYYPISTTQIAPLETQFSTLATSVQTAFNAHKQITVATAAALGALTLATYPNYVAYVSGNGSLWYNTGTKWQLANEPVVASSAARDALYSGLATVTQGDIVFRNDTGWTETYYGLYNVSTNPGGVSVAGWYPVAGNLPKAMVRRSTTAVTLSNAWTDRSATANWTEYFRQNVIAYNNGWTVPVSGFYQLDVRIQAADFVGFAVAPTTAPTSQTSTGIVLSAIGGGVAFSTGSANGTSTARLTAGDVLKIGIVCNSSAAWHTTTTTLDGNHFGITYISPPFGA